VLHFMVLDIDIPPRGSGDERLIVWLQRQTPGVLMIIKVEECEDASYPYMGGLMTRCYDSGKSYIIKRKFSTIRSRLDRAWMLRESLNDRGL
jgi:hypothetical protein